MFSLTQKRRNCNEMAINFILFCRPGIIFLMKIVYLLEVTEPTQLLNPSSEVSDQSFLLLAIAFLSQFSWGLK
jgi:hypothetical protein